MTRDKDRPRRPSPTRLVRDGRDASPEVTVTARPLSLPAPVAPTRQRIAKVIARAGLCSRRDAEAWIVEGRVAVNGAVLSSPATDVGPDDAIVVDGQPLPVAEKTRLFLFHKPRGLVTSDHDPEGRETVFGFLREHWPDGPRVVTIGRLDINTEGLLLLTNDGGLARVLELPKTGWVRRYRVRAKGETDQGALDTLRDGVSIGGIDYAGIEATLDRVQGANCWLTMGLREGKNREIKRVLEHLGLEVNRLIRLSFGPFQLLDLEQGKVDEVRTRILRDQLGERIAAEAGVTFEIEVEKTLQQEEPRREARRPVPAKDTRRSPEGAARRTDIRGAGGDRRPARGRPERGAQIDEPGHKRRERPVAGTRKHVSALRADSTAAPIGARRRVERSDVKDRRDRTVTVERVVSTRTDAAPRSPHSASSRGTPVGVDHASPSALAKRQRIAKSAGPRVERESDAPVRGRRDQVRAGGGQGRSNVGAPARDQTRGKPRGASARTGMRADAGRRQEDRPQGSRRPSGRGESGERPADRRQNHGEPPQSVRPGRAAGRDGAQSRPSRPSQGRGAASRERSDERRPGKPRAAKGGIRDRKDADRSLTGAGPRGRAERTGAPSKRARTRPKTPPKGSGSPRRK